MIPTPQRPLTPRIPLFDRPYAPEGTQYPREFLVPVTPLDASVVSLYVPILVEHEPCVATICDLLMETDAGFVAEYRLVEEADGATEWFRYVPQVAFRVYLKTLDDQTDYTNNVQLEPVLFNRGLTEAVSIVAAAVAA